MQRRTGAAIAVGLVTVAAIAWWLQPGPAVAPAPDSVAVVAATDGKAAPPPAPRPAASSAVVPASPAPAASPTPEAAPADMMVAGMPLREDEPRALHARFAAERRDPAWAPRAEAALRGQVAGITLLHQRPDPVTVACRASVCEIAGVMPPGTSDAAVGAAMASLQDRAMAEGAARQGLATRVAMFSEKDGRSSYALFYARR